MKLIASSIQALIHLSVYRKITSLLPHIHSASLASGRAQDSCFKSISCAGLFAWRDRIAREWDESTGFVMPKVLLMKLCKSIPRTAQDLLKLLGQ